MVATGGRATGGAGCGAARGCTGGVGRCGGCGACGCCGTIGGTMKGVDSSGVVSAAAVGLPRVMLFSDFIGSACAAMFGCAAA
jgi:hypothetical protein